MTRHHFQPTQYHNVIGTLPAVLEIASGDRVVTTTLDAAGTDHESAQRAPRGNPMTGPFFVTGAEPGDALLVTVERMTPNRKTGWTYSPLAPGVLDPAILAVVCLVVIPIPFGTVRRALADILLVTPAELKQHVDEVAEVIVARYGFLSYRSYVARVGRGRQIELYFIVPTGWPAKRLEEWDRIRDEISEAIGGDTADRWLTIVFTTDEEWADGTPREVIE